MLMFIGENLDFQKETVYTASRAAARGGFTTVMTMPNLNPVPDSVETLNKQLEIIKMILLLELFLMEQ